jgi:hypothetical protein
MAISAAILEMVEGRGVYELHSLVGVALVKACSHAVPGNFIVIQELGCLAVVQLGVLSGRSLLSLKLSCLGRRVRAH